MSPTVERVRKSKPAGGVGSVPDAERFTIQPDDTRRIVVIGADRRMKWVSAEFARALGFTCNDLTNRNIETIVHPRDGERHRRLLRGLFDGEHGSFHLSVDFCGKDGRTHAFTVAASLASHEPGQPAFAVQIVREAAADAAAPEVGPGHTAWMQRVYEEVPAGYFTVGADGVVKAVNRFGADMLGFAVEALVGRPFIELYADDRDGKEKARQLIAAFRRGQPIRGAELRLRRANGDPFWGSLTADGIFDERGNLIHWQSVVVDITARKVVEEQLRAERDRSRRIIDGTPSIISGIAPDGTTTFVNPMAERVTGYPAAEIVGREWWKLLCPGTSYLQVKALLAELAVRDVQDHEMIITTRAGEPRIVLWSSVKHVDEAGHLTEVVGIGHDVTERRQAERERKELESRLRLAEKMETIGRLAGGIAHDFNNVLTPILGYTDLLRSYVASDGEVGEALDGISKAGNRAKALVQQILTFSRQDESVRQVVDLNVVVAEVLALLRPTAPSTIEVATDIDERCAPILASATQIHQVLMNLCTNACHAMPDGGVLFIGLTTVDVDADLVKRHSNLRECSYVRLTVSDTGHGMHEETLRRMWEPFFTTKPDGQGTGMGLSVVHGIVVGHDGEFLIESAPGVGTKVEVYLPATDGRDGTDTNPPVAKAIAGGTERILVVDDELAIAGMMKTVLERIGYHVTTSPDGRAALRMIRDDPDSFDLVLSDETMPHMKGTELAREIKNLRPDLPVIIATGNQEAIGLSGLEAVGVESVLAKPFDTADLAKIIADNLRARRSVT